jgi:hypothetical protein
MLDKEFKYFVDHQNELNQKYNGRYIVIKDENVIGDYANELVAYTETSKHHKVGTFLIQLCIPGTQAYTQTFHSRVYLVNT